VRCPTLGEASLLVRAGKYTPTQLVDEALAQIELTEPKLKVWVTIDTEGAKAAAAQLTKEAEEGHIRSPLHGIPFGVKDIFDTKGLKTTMGSPLFRDNVPASDAAIVARLRDLGAIVLGKTHTTEFAGHDPAPTCNPWNLAHTPGGSSSGSAAAVAAGVIPYALGSQTGGSVTRPASYCGIVGTKPTYDLISKTGVYPLSWSLDHVGFLTSNVEDASMILKALAGIEVDQMAKPPTIGVADRYFAEKADPEISEGFNYAVRKLGESSVEIKEIALPKSFDYAHSAHRVIMTAEAAAVHEPLFSKQPGDYRPYLRGQVASGLLVPSTAYLRALRIQAIYRKEMIGVMSGCDVVATPAATSAAPKGLEWTGDPAFNSVWSLAGFPTITIPMGLTKDGLPMGLQLAASPFAESRLLAVAMFSEKALRFHSYPPPPT